MFERRLLHAGGHRPRVLIPLKYFDRHGLPRDWSAFHDDFRHHWPTDEDNTYVEFVRDGTAGNGAARSGDAKWRRVTKVRAGATKSVFHFDVQDSVAKSTHAGLPWRGTSANDCPAESTSSPSTAGHRHRGGRSSPRFTPLSGAVGSPAAAERPTSTTPGLSQSGCGGRTFEAPSRSSSYPITRKRTRPVRLWRAGFWGFGDAFGGWRRRLAAEFDPTV